MSDYCGNCRAGVDENGHDENAGDSTIVYGMVEHDGEFSMKFLLLSLENDSRHFSLA